MLLKASLLLVAALGLVRCQYNRRVQAPARQTAGVVFPNRNEGGSSQRQCNGIGYHRMTTAQTMYVQYEEFVTKLPRLQQFSTCFWVNVEDPLRPATLLNYAMDEAVNNDNITLQYEGKEQRWKLKINGQDAYTSKAAQLPRNTWVHLCHSWSGRTGEWSVWQGGLLLDSGVNQHTRGWIIPAGGVLVTGQHQNTITGGGMDRGAGLVGSLTLMHVSDKPLPPADDAARRFVAAASRDCSPTPRAEMVDWVSTPRKGYGGVTSTLAKPVCGVF